MNDKERGTFLTLFIRGNGDKVFNLSKPEFNARTMSSIGVRLCDKYDNKSEAASLMQYVDEAKKADVDKLLLDLFDYYEIHFEHEYDPDLADDSDRAKHRQSLYKKCKVIAERERATSPLLSETTADLKSKFNSEYMKDQINLLMKMRDENSVEAIGKAKELIESCCKTILENQGDSAERDMDVAQLSKQTAKILAIDEEEFSLDLEVAQLAEKAQKKIQGGLQSIASGVSELRNGFGAGHGRSATFQELPVRYAKLAVGASITLVEFYWEVYEWRKEQGCLK